jgi:hypothetical protein
MRHDDIDEGMAILNDAGVTIDATANLCPLTSDL